MREISLEKGLLQENSGLTRKPIAQITTNQTTNTKQLAQVRLNQ